MNIDFRRIITIFVIVLALYGFTNKYHRMNVLKFSPQIGGRYSYAIAEKYTTMNRIGSKELEFKGNSGASLTFQVDQRIETGYSINATINSFSIDALEDGRFDSPEQGADTNENEQGFVPNLENDTMRLKIDAFGGLNAIEGYERVRQKILTSYGIYLGSFTMAKEKLGSGYSMEYFQELFGACFYNLPDENATHEKKWNRTAKFDLNGPIDILIQYKFEQSPDGLAYINGESSGIIESGYFKNSKFHVIHKLKLDETTGMITTSETTIAVLGILPNTNNIPFEVHRTKTVQALKSF